MNSIEKSSKLTSPIDAACAAAPAAAVTEVKAEGGWQKGAVSLYKLRSSHVEDPCIFNAIKSPTTRDGIFDHSPTSSNSTRTPYNLSRQDSESPPSSIWDMVANRIEYEEKSIQFNDGPQLRLQFNDLEEEEEHNSFGNCPSNNSFENSPSNNRSKNRTIPTCSSFTLLGAEPSADATPLLSTSTLPEQIVDLEYAVRGPVVSRAEEISKEIAAHPESKPFTNIIPANIGNPQAVGQLPITFNRQVLACLLSPRLLETKDAEEGTALYPSDVVARAKRYLNSIPAIGAYSHSKGVELFRRDIADWIGRRDGFNCDPESVMMTDGASSAIRLTLEILISKPTDGILIPVPQYPLYSASITRLRGTAVEYYLDEEKNWGLNIEDIEYRLRVARENGIDVRGLVLINPGNPTGAVMTSENLKEVVRLCKLNGLVLMADEVYQANVYVGSFVSAREIVLRSNSEVQLFSFHSASKGLCGECGLRGGYLQTENVSSDVRAMLYKLFCVQLCSNTIGQALMTCLLTPPIPGDPSYQQYQLESTAIFNALKKKALMAEQRLNALPKIRCPPITGAMYAFPRIDIPLLACKAAAAKSVEPDFFYCMELLETVGVICVPGSGFSQAPNTYHFRITILPHESLFVEMLERIETFHLEFLRRYST